ncbi:hypothetical protein QR46_1943 [Giardia duodenalis assemblage B]|uniref:Uncharacterized protein n=1 Tax=Giardia duodenalis assemblage B TaxID=1394984 RepID=A0A132NVE9_GIAIN|nr:hypothetical protein QR46_1943 [Giardia intestinalis assemblage B]
MESQYANKMNPQEWELVSGFQQAKEASLAQDLARIRAELAHERALVQQMQLNREQELRDMSARELHAQSALAASQLRVEQLSALVHDMRSELIDLRTEKGEVVKRLDAAREEYLNMQRMNAQSRERIIELEAKQARQKSLHDEEILKIRKAMTGASSIMALIRGHDGATDPGYDAVVDTLLQVYTGNMQYADPEAPLRREDNDLLLGRIASLARDIDTLRRENSSLKEERRILQDRIVRLESLTRKVTEQGLVAPSMKLLMAQLEEKEQAYRRQEDMLLKARETCRAAEDMLDNKEREVRSLKLALKDLTVTLKQVDEIRGTVRALIQEETRAETLHTK